MAVPQLVELRIPVPWGHLAACWYGDRRERPLVAVHGWQSNAGSFARLAPLIARRVPVLAIELPGHGRSSHLPVGCIYHNLDFMQALKLVMEYFKWPRISFLAHSLGAIICFYFASLYPRHTDLLISLDMLHPAYLPLNTQIMMLQLIIERIIIETERIEQATGDTQREMPLYTMSKLEWMMHHGAEGTIETQNCKYLLDRAICRSSKQADRFYFTRDNRLKVVMMAMHETSLLVAMAQRMQELNLLVISAKDSQFFQQHPDVIAALRSTCRTFEHSELEDGNHFLHLNRPNECFQLIEPFLAKHWVIDELMEEVNGMPLAKL